MGGVDEWTEKLNVPRRWAEKTGKWDKPGKEGFCHFEMAILYYI